MVDDRDFSQYKNFKSVDKNYIGFKKYLQRVIADPSRGQELEILIKFFGIETLERVLDGKQIIEASSFLKLKG